MNIEMLQKSPDINFIQNNKKNEEENSMPNLVRGDIIFEWSPFLGCFILYYKNDIHVLSLSF